MPILLLLLLLVPVMEEENDEIRVKVSEFHSIIEAGVPLVACLHGSLDSLIYNHMFNMHNIHSNGESVYYTDRSGAVHSVPFIQYRGRILPSWKANLETPKYITCQTAESGYSISWPNE